MTYAGRWSRFRMPLPDRTYFVEVVHVVNRQTGWSLSTVFLCARRDVGHHTRMSAWLDRVSTNRVRFSRRSPCPVGDGTARSVSSGSSLQSPMTSSVVEPRLVNPVAVLLFRRDSTKERAVATSVLFGGNRLSARWQEVFLLVVPSFPFVQHHVDAFVFRQVQVPGTHIFLLVRRKRIELRARLTNGHPCRHPGRPVSNPCVPFNEFRVNGDVLVSSVDYGRLRLCLKPWRTEPCPLSRQKPVVSTIGCAPWQEVTPTATTSTLR